MLRASLLAIGLLGATNAAAQPAPSRPRTSVPIAAEPCDLSGQPQACESCPSLLAALRLPGAGIGDAGPAADGVVWSPLFVAFRLNCQEAGRTLISRGANPQRGGSGGALLADVAAQHFARTDQPPATRQTLAIEWVALLARPRPFDLDIAGTDGTLSARAAWSMARSNGALPPGAGVVWSRIEAASAAYPVLMDGAERVGVDAPAPDTGITRPSETAVSRGVEAMFATYDRTGMTGVVTRVQACWAEPQPADLPRVKLRWHLEHCAAMDTAAAILDEAMSKRLGGPRMGYYESDALFGRLTALEAFRPDGLQPGPYMRALHRSVTAWLPIQFAIRSKP